MSYYIRPKIPGATVFFTVSLAQRGSNLLIGEIDRLRAAVGRTRRDRPFAVNAWVVLPDHMLCIWTLPVGDSDYSTRWSIIKSRFSRGLPNGHRRVSHQSRREKGIWQRRFWEHHIKDADDLAKHREECWMAPVRQGLVSHPDQWEYSSFYRNLQETRLAS